ncbi:AEC family transporter [Enterococcus canintestini]|uniref:AEC family transporter n=1 Tax=Enterococcus canintestini TaxID=317010 RepID=UPI00288EE10A|nr:AEC family transporter [Enterococcus canintestini]MDT2738506.1 transporter [Enterococcus canintestini]
MKEILISAFSLLFIIFLGYLFKRFGIFSKADGNRLSQIILNLTLPAAIVVNLAQLNVSFNITALIAIAVFFTLVQLLFLRLFKGRQSRRELSFSLYMGSGFNIGNFTLPFAQSFIPQAIPLISLFDIGNSIMLAGGTGLVVEALTGENYVFNLKAFLQKLGRSVPFMCYLVLLLLRTASIAIPEMLITVVAPIASANTFLSMFMIGLYLEFKLPHYAWLLVLKTLLLRYTIGLILVVIVYFTPISQLMKLVLSILAVTPIPIFNVMNAVLSGSDEESVGFCSSLSFLISLPLMTALIFIYR